MYSVLRICKFVTTAIDGVGTYVCRSPDELLRYLKHTSSDEGVAKPLVEFWV